MPCFLCSIMIDMITSSLSSIVTLILEHSNSHFRAWPHGFKLELIVSYHYLKVEILCDQIFTSWQISVWEEFSWPCSVFCYVNGLFSRRKEAMVQWFLGYSLKSLESQKTQTDGSSPQVLVQFYNVLFSCLKNKSDLLAHVTVKVRGGVSLLSVSNVNLPPLFYTKMCLPDFAHWLVFLELPLLC